MSTRGADTRAAGVQAHRDRSFREILQQLRSAQKKAAPGSPAYSVYVNRRLGRLLAAVAFRAGMTPNGVTAVSAAFTFGALLALAIVPSSWILGIAVALALAIGYAFDSADGQLARLRGGGSLAGEWLDHVIDCTKTAALHLVVFIQLARFVALPSDLLLLIPLGFAVVASVAFFAAILNDQLKAGRPPEELPGRPASALRSVVLIPTDYGVLCLAFSLLGSPLVFLAVYSVLFAANLGYLLLALRKWFNDMRRLDRLTAGLQS